VAAVCSLAVVDVDALAQILEGVGLGELFEPVLEVGVTEAHLDAVRLGGDSGGVVAVVTLHGRT